MIYLVLQIQEVQGRVYITDHSTRRDPTEDEEQKWKLFFEAIREASITEAKRLKAKGRGKTTVGVEAAEKLNITPETNPEIFEQMPPSASGE